MDKERERVIEEWREREREEREEWSRGSRVEH